MGGNANSQVDIWLTLNGFLKIRPEAIVFINETAGRIPIGRCKGLTLPVHEIADVCIEDFPEIFQHLVGFVQGFGVRIAFKMASVLARSRPAR